MGTEEALIAGWIHGLLWGRWAHSLPPRLPREFTTSLSARPRDVNRDFAPGFWHVWWDRARLSHPTHRWSTSNKSLSSWPRGELCRDDLIGFSSLQQPALSCCRRFALELGGFFSLVQAKLINLQGSCRDAVRDLRRWKRKQQPPLTAGRRAGPVLGHPGALGTEASRSRCLWTPSSDELNSSY